MRNVKLGLKTAQMWQREAAICGFHTWKTVRKSQWSELKTACFRQMSRNRSIEQGSGCHGTSRWNQFWASCFAAMLGKMQAPSNFLQNSNLCFLENNVSQKKIKNTQTKTEDSLKSNQAKFPSYLLFFSVATSDTFETVQSTAPFSCLTTNSNLCHSTMNFRSCAKRTDQVLFHVLIIRTIFCSFQILNFQIMVRDRYLCFRNWANLPKRPDSLRFRQNKQNKDHVHVHEYVAKKILKDHMSRKNYSKMWSLRLTVQLL